MTRKTWHCAKEHYRKRLFGRQKAKAESGAPRQKAGKNGRNSGSLGNQASDLLYKSCHGSCVALLKRNKVPAPAVALSYKTK